MSWRSVIGVDVPLVHELHHADVGEQLGDGADAIDRSRGGRDAVSRIRKPEAARPDHLLIFDEGDRERWQILVGHLARHEAREYRCGRRITRRGRHGVPCWLRPRLDGDEEQDEEGATTDVS
jgi:hypothetical protein